MKICGIIAEYNPFHNGHLYLIHRLRDMGYSHIVAVMSGNFVQRGETAIMSKWPRTECALKSGVDLVIELPLTWAMSAAQNFALGGVSLLNSLGCVDMLAFGCEIDDISELSRAVNVKSSDAFKTAFADEIDKGKSYAAAASAALDKSGESINPDIFRMPNCILAQEYISALNRLNSKITPIAIKRHISAHDEMHKSAPDNTDIVSAAYIRELIKSGSDFRQYVPKFTADIIDRELALKSAPADISRLERAILAFLRKCEPDDFTHLPDVNEGLQNRIYTAAKNSQSYGELIDKIKTKRYTHARLRRTILSAFLDIDVSLFNAEPPYIRILGFNERGKEILRLARESAVPIIMKAADINHLSESCRRLFEAENRADDIYALSLPVIGGCGSNMTNGVIH